MPRPRILVPLLSTAALLVFVAQVFSVTYVTTWHNDQARTGANTTEAILNPANVNFTQFGKLFSIPVDGAVVRGKGSATGVALVEVYQLQ